VIGALVATTIVLPRILGTDRWHGHGVHPGVVLVALTIGGVVGGPLGMVLGVPVVIVLRDVAPSVIAALNGTLRPEPHEGIVPRWLDRLAQWSWRLLILATVTAVAVAALAQVPLIVIPLVLAAVAAATLAPGAAILLRRGLAPTTASLAMTAGGFGLILVILVVTLTSLAEPLQEIVATAIAGAGTIDDTIGTETVASVVAAIGPQLVQAAAVVVAGIAGLTISIVLGAILTFYLLRDGVRALEVVTRPLAPWRQDELEAAAGRATSILGNYMIGTGAISAVGAASQFLVMTILGIPLAWPLAILSFFGGFIPYIGSLLTTLLAFLVTVAVGSTQDILIMAIFTLVFNIVQGNIVAPLVYGKAVSIHPAVVLLAIPAGAAVAGIAGMFLAVPVIGVVATTWRTVLRVFGSEPPDRAYEPGTDVEAAGAVSRAATT
jgi:predicted PurR-regulated permease PerM